MVVTFTREEIEMEERKEEGVETVFSWSVEDVAWWLERRGFGDLADTFSEMLVDGDLLMQLSERDLKEDLGVRNGIVRKRLWRELRKLMRNVDYSLSEGESTAQFLRNISSELVEYTHRLVTRGLTHQYMDTLAIEDVEDALKHAGVENIAHRYKIKQALKTQPEKVEEYDVYLSYVETSKTFASLVEIYLRMRGLVVFKDLRDSTRISQESLANIDRSNSFVVVLPANAGEMLDKVDDAAKEEFIHAVEAGVTIIPVVEEDFKGTEDGSVGELLRQMMEGRRVVRWIHEYQEASMDKLEDIIRREGGRRGWGRGGSDLQFSKMRSVSVDSGIESLIE